MTASLASDALDLFEQQGYDATSIDDICRASEVSRTTFFRYFPTKEDALMGTLADVDAQVVQVFQSQPANAPIWSSLRAVLDSIVDAYTGDEKTTLRILRVFGDTPALGAFHQVKVNRWMRSLEPELFQRLGLHPGRMSPGPSALLGTAFACLDAALASWAQNHDTHTLPDLLDDAMGAVLAAANPDSAVAVLSARSGE